MDESRMLNFLTTCGHVARKFHAKFGCIRSRTTFGRLSSQMQIKIYTCTWNNHKLDTPWLVLMSSYLTKIPLWQTDRLSSCGSISTFTEVSPTTVRQHVLTFGAMRYPTDQFQCTQKKVVIGTTGEITGRWSLKTSTTHQDLVLRLRWLRFKIFQIPRKT